MGEARGCFAFGSMGEAIGCFAFVAREEGSKKDVIFQT